MSNDYDDYAKWEAQKANVAAGRKPDSSGTFEEALSKPRYNGYEGEVQVEREPTVYRDENGKEFRFIFGQRVYLD